MPVTLITFADLGTKGNLKTPGIMPLINKFRNKKKLQKIICRLDRDFDFPNTVQGVNTFLHYLFGALGKTDLFSYYPRKLEEGLFDYKSSMYLDNDSEIVFFHPSTTFPKSAKQAKKLGSVSVGIATNAHPITNGIFELEEEKVLNKKIRSSSAQNRREELSKNIDSLDYIVAFSDFVKRSYENNKFPAEKIFVANSDIDIDYFNPEVKKEHDVFRVLFIAHIGALKGLHYLIEAWRNLDLKNSELTILGGFHSNTSSDIKKKYRQEISLFDNVEWVGFSDDVKYYYNRSSLFVLPSLTEGNPKVVMEAMASGLPVITTENARSIIEYGKSGFVVPVRDSKAIKERIEYLYHNKDEGRRIGRQARAAMVEKRPFGEAVYEIYEEICRREGL